MPKQIDYTVEFRGFSGDWHKSNSANLGVNRNPFPSRAKAMAGLRLALTEPYSGSLDYRVVRRTRIVEETMSITDSFPKDKR